MEVVILLEVEVRDIAGGEIVSVIDAIAGAAVGAAAGVEAGAAATVCAMIGAVTTGGAATATTEGAVATGGAAASTEGAEAPAGAAAMARNVFEGCCAVRSRDHGACWPDQLHTYQSIMKLLSIKRLSNNSQLQRGNVSKLAMSFTTFGICCWRRCHRKVSCDCTELSHCTENYKCKNTETH